MQSAHHSSSCRRSGDVPRWSRFALPSRVSREVKSVCRPRASTAGQVNGRSAGVRPGRTVLSGLLTSICPSSATGIIENDGERDDFACDSGRTSVRRTGANMVRVAVGSRQPVKVSGAAEQWSVRQRFINTMLRRREMAIVTKRDLPDQRASSSRLVDWHEAALSAVNRALSVAVR